MNSVSPVTANNPRILHVINDLSTGGAELLLSNTIRLLPDFEHIVVYLFPGSDLIENFREQGVELISLGHKGWSNIFASARKLRSIVRKKTPLLVHSHLFQATICARLGVPASVPLVSTIHSLYSKDLFGTSVKSLLVARLTLKKRHTLIAVSDCVMKDYLGYVPFKGKRFILHNFLPPSVFQKRTDYTRGDVIKLVAVGNLKDAKNYPYLLEIFKHLKDVNVSLDIYGTGLLHEKLEAYIQREGLNVRLCGGINDASRILQQYDFFIQASSHEGFGLSVIEAMACSIPVILSDIPVFRETTNNLASFFPLENAKKAADIIKAALDNKESGSLCNQAFEYVRNNYSAESYRQKLLDIYKRVTAGNQNSNQFITSVLSG